MINPQVARAGIFLTGTITYKFSARASVAVCQWFVELCVGADHGWSPINITLGAFYQLRTWTVSCFRGQRCCLLSKIPKSSYLGEVEGHGVLSPTLGHYLAVNACHSLRCAETSEMSVSQLLLPQPLRLRLLSAQVQSRLQHLGISIVQLQLQKLSFLMAVVLNRLLPLGLLLNLHLSFPLCNF